MDRRGLIRAMWEWGVLQFGTFRLSSGGVSSYYIDMRRALSNPTLYRAIVELLAEKAMDVDLVAGVETAGIPWASMVAYRLGKGLIYVRKQPKEHGTGQLIEGVYRAGQTAVVIDDVATTGASLKRGVEALRAAGIIVKRALAIVDRSGGQLDVGAPFESIFTVEEVFNELGINAP